VTAAALLLTGRYLGIARASRAVVGAPADEQIPSDDQEKSPDADSSAKDFGEGVELSTRGRVRSPAIEPA